MSDLIRKWDDPILKTACQPVAPGEDVTDLIALMRRALAESRNGVGLAAPQVGVAKRVILVRNDCLINPVIGWRSPKTSKWDEGCLSYPGITAEIERHVAVGVRYERPDRSVVKRMKFRGFDARIVQHEIDHLDGICRVGDAWRESSAAKGGV